MVFINIFDRNFNKYGIFKYNNFSLECKLPSKLNKIIIYIQKYIDKKNIFFGTNYKINKKDLKDYVFDKKLLIATI